MRTILLASAALIGLAGMTDAYAQTAAPDAAVPNAMAPDTAAPDAAPPSASTDTQVPAAPAHHYRHHRMATQTDGAASGQWAHEPGTGQSGPASERASNIDGSDTRSEIAPHLPQPHTGMNAWGYLQAADSALARHRTGEAQQELEMAETRFLDRSTPAGTESQPNQAPLVTQVSQARQALGHGDIAGAHAAIQMALSNPHNPANGGGVQPQADMAPGMSPGMGMPASQPGGAPMGNATPTSAGMAPSGAGPTPGATAGAAMGGGPVGTGTADSAGGAK